MARIQLYDTTLRDGSQGEGVNFSLQDKLMIAQKLDDLGFDYIEVATRCPTLKTKSSFSAPLRWNGNTRRSPPSG